MSDTWRGNYTEVSITLLLFIRQECWREYENCVFARLVGQVTGGGNSVEDPILVSVSLGLAEIQKYRTCLYPT